VDRRRSGSSAVHLRLYNLTIGVMRLRTLLGKIVYWLAVLAISVALLILLVLFFEARDSSDLQNSTRPAAAIQLAAPAGQPTAPGAARSPVG
jgi:hypothetical protein